MDYYFEDFQPGTVFTSAPYRIDGDRIIAFAQEFDPQPFHLDRAAANASIFGGLVASGFHSAALCLKLALETGVFRHCGIAGLGVDALRWVQPVRDGATVHLTFEALEARPSSSKPDRGAVNFQYTLHDQDNVPLLYMQYRKLLRRRPS